MSARSARAEADEMLRRFRLVERADEHGHADTDHNGANVGM